MTSRNMIKPLCLRQRQKVRSIGIITSCMPTGFGIYKTSNQYQYIEIVILYLRQIFVSNENQ